MPTYIAVIVSKKKNSKRPSKRKLEVFAGCVTEAEKMVEPELRRGEKIYDIASKMNNSMAFERILNGRK